MAANIQGIEKTISGLEEERSAYQKKLEASSTALGGISKPSGFDISNQRSLERIQNEIQRLTNEKLKAQWYPPKDDPQDDSGEAQPKPGFFMRGLDYLTRPLYGIVGATKHFTGQGTESLQKDIADNVLRNKNLFGDVLRSAGASGIIATPIGFALDIALDPVNWATVGTGAMIPRLATGAVKGFTRGEGIVRGISAAAKSGALEKASTIGRFTPFFRKSGMFQKVGESALRATDTWESLIGKTALDFVMQRGVGIGSYRRGLAEIANTVAERIPGGKDFLGKFIYDPVEWVRQARIKDAIQRALGVDAEDVKAATNAIYKGESIEPYLQKAAKSVKNISPVDVDFNAAGVNNATKKEADLAISKLQAIGRENIINAADDVVSGADDAAEILKNPTPYISTDPAENASRIVSEVNKTVGGGVTLEDIAKVVNSGILDETGVKWFDNMMKSVRNYTITIDRNSNRVLEVGKKTMDFYDKAMALFRVAKVAASPTAWVNAVVGNMIMNHMATGSISPRFLNRLRQTVGLYLNKPARGALFDRLMMDAGGADDVIRRAFYENETAFRRTFGDIDFIGNPEQGGRGASYYTAQISLQRAIDTGSLPSTMKVEDLLPDFNEALGEAAMLYDKKIKELSLNVKGGTAFTMKSLKSGGVETGTGMLGAELFKDKAAFEVFRKVEQMAKDHPNHLGWMLLDTVLNKAPSGYETIDQIYKMATFITSTVDGYTLNELRRISKLVDINPEELVKYVPRSAEGKLLRGGEYLYRLSPRTAIELSNVMYLNYAAMPAAIRVLRNLPLLGSPFASFMYGMALKTGQTIVYNPSAFNKISFALNEFGGPETPLEKRALESEIYSYLRQPGMFRTPFFSENPVYLNMSSMIPYYSLNMFNPQGQRYSGGTVGEKLVQAVQDSPLLKDPVGSNLFDFLIQPLILDEAITPQGQFGQPLYPVDANLGEKAFYGVRSLSEAFVPNVAAYAGLITPESAVDYIPSYRWRSLARATVGKNQLGIGSKEPKSSRILRNIFSTTGIPVQNPVNTTFIPEK